jgi:hypothetical protein
MFSGRAASSLGGLRMLRVPDFSGQGIPVDAKGMQPAADLPPSFQQRSLLRGHGFTADELRTMSPADVAREYAQAVREGAQPPGAAHNEAQRHQLQAEADQAEHAAKQAAHIRAMQAEADRAVAAARDAAARKRAAVSSTPVPRAAAAAAPPPGGDIPAEFSAESACRRRGDEPENKRATRVELFKTNAKNVNSCSRTGPIHGQRCSPGFGLKV